MSLQVKIFLNGSDYQALEKEINLFLCDKSIELIDIIYSTSECESSWNGSALLVYKLKHKKSSK